MVGIARRGRRLGPAPPHSVTPDRMLCMSMAFRAFFFAFCLPQGTRLDKAKSFVNILAALMRWSNVDSPLCRTSSNALRTILLVDAMLLPRSFPFQPSPPAQEVCAAPWRVNFPALTHVIAPGAVLRSAWRGLSAP